ncbi:uncharacterized protein LOC122393625 [Amphibalanus amphitrite]|uniref:uncharacterized protein LOC122393625 n=1 Tax=Amphibalanus amphitrite TaxID=1232801 RepID=UPI001C8FBB3B|nr:uncharacterized protein LOC122393625 [Amphibalanus amphitrite]
MNLRAPTELNFSAVNMAAEWARFSRDWKYYAAAKELAEKPVLVQVGTFLNYAGIGAQEVASHFQWQDSDGLPPLLEKFEAYCNPRRNVVLERYNFHARVQQPGESITTFLAALRSLVVTCEFPDPDNMIRDRLVIGVADRATQRALLRQADLTLTAAVDIALSEEASRRDQQCMGSAGSATGDVLNPSEVSAISQPSPAPAVSRCRFCARVHVMQRSSCPAWGQSCHACGGRNHFSACCGRPAGARPLSPRGQDGGFSGVTTRSGGASTGQRRNDSRLPPRSVAPPVPVAGDRGLRSATRAGGGRRDRDGVAAIEQADQDAEQVQVGGPALWH